MIFSQLSRIFVSLNRFINSLMVVTTCIPTILLYQRKFRFLCVSSYAVSCPTRARTHLSTCKPIAVFKDIFVCPGYLFSWPLQWATLFSASRRQELIPESSQFLADGSVIVFLCRFCNQTNVISAHEESGSDLCHLHARIRLRTFLLFPHPTTFTLH